MEYKGCEKGVPVVYYLAEPGVSFSNTANLNWWHNGMRKSNGTIEYYQNVLLTFLDHFWNSTPWTAFQVVYSQWKRRQSFDTEVWSKPHFEWCINEERRRLKQKRGGVLRAFQTYLTFCNMQQYLTNRFTGREYSSFRKFLL